MEYQIAESPEMKAVKSDKFNYLFNKRNGFTMVWGEKVQENPEYSPYGPMIADIELSTICHGGCKHCYKSNTDSGTNMSFETFKGIFDKFPKVLTQIAFGIGDIDANPDLWKIMEYCRSNGVIPNITINGYRMTPELYDNLAKYCGAVAVSLYDFETCSNAVYELTNRGMKQVNIHALWSEETKDQCYSMVEKIAHRGPWSRLRKLNAIVFLRLKTHGRGISYHQASQQDFNKLVNMAIESEINFGFDSCSAPAFLKSVKGHKNYKNFETLAEPCESFGLFSCYINVDGKYFPCSFAEGEPGWENGIDVKSCSSFIGDVWYNKQVNEWRERSIKSKDDNGCRQCLLYNLE